MEHHVGLAVPQSAHTLLPSPPRTAATWWARSRAFSPRASVAGGPSSSSVLGWLFGLLFDFGGGFGGATPCPRACIIPSRSVVTHAL